VRLALQRIFGQVSLHAWRDLKSRKFLPLTVADEMASEPLLAKATRQRGLQQDEERLCFLKGSGRGGSQTLNSRNLLIKKIEKTLFDLLKSFMALW
jgi:hypothetical protein